jgi:transposase-like protein
MTGITSVDFARRAGENLKQANPNLLLVMVQAFAQALMGAEADALCEVPYDQVSEERVKYRNGYRERALVPVIGHGPAARLALRAGEAPGHRSQSRQSASGQGGCPGLRRT